ncbi:MAG: CGNR zinc finger domain-containing protein [Planctomycetes bacterium]|nr:CGNR zinc finger domain-containing protein [Planctomycetota bacterium]
MDPLWAELINSDWHDYLGQGRDEDRLDKPSWLAEFLSRWGLPRLDVESPGSRRRLRELRVLLSRLALKLHGQKPLSVRDLTDLNTFLDRESVVRRLRRDKEGYTLYYVPVKGSLNAVLSEITASFADMLTSGDPTRIRVCENRDCRWIMYDRSKNRTRRWCEGPTGCGNLIKVRRHRARKRQQATHQQ